MFAVVLSISKWPGKPRQAVRLDKRPGWVYNGGMRNNKCLRVVIFSAMAVHLAVSGALAEGEKVYSRRTPIVEAYEKVRHAVVNISSSRVVNTDWFGLGAFGDIWQLPGPFHQQRKLTSLGSGFLIHRDGYVVTNYHVIAQATDILVSTADNKEFSASVVRADAGHDLAVIKLNTRERLDEITLGTAKDLMVGETVIAVGNPLGLHHSLTAGVASATNRTIEFGAGFAYRNLIQTSAPINPGSSGGPLLNINGEVVGINTAIRADAQNIGFAVSIDNLTSQLAKLLRPKGTEQITPGFEVGLRRKTPDAGFDIVVSSVPAGSTAAKAGVEVGDVVKKIGGREVSGLADYYLAWQGVSPGRVLEITVSKSGKAEMSEIILTALVKRGPDLKQLAWAKLGMQLDTSKEPERGKIGYQVVAMQDRGPAHQGGVRPGDVVFSVGPRLLEDRETLAEALEEISAGEKVALGYVHQELLGTAIRRVEVRAR